MDAKIVIIFITTIVSTTFAKPANVEDGKDAPYMEVTKGELLARIQKLEAELAKVKGVSSDVANLKSKLIAGGYDKYTVYDLQWQSLHMAATAGCRAVSPYGGHGGYANRVLPRVTGVSCEQTCNKTSYKNCDGEMAINGKISKATGSTQILGSYYNYRCSTSKLYAADELKSLDQNVITSGSYYSYCCCRK